MANNNLELALKIKAAVDGLQGIQSLIGEIEDLGGSAGKAGERGKELAAELHELTRQATLIEQFRKLKIETQDTSKQLAAAQGNAQQLGRQLGETEKPTKRLNTAFEKARREVTRLKQAERGQKTELQGLRRQLSGAGVDTRKLSDEQIRIRRAVKSSEDAVDRLGNELKETRKQTARQFRDPTKKLRTGAAAAERRVSGLGGALTGLKGKLLAFIGVAGGLALVKKGLGSILSTGAEFEQLNIQFEALMGSVAEGEKAFAWVKQFAMDTPLELEQVAQSFASLKAFGIDPMNGTLQALTDEAAKLGGGYETLRGISLAVGQAWAKQKLQGEEILQLVERGVPVWDLLAKVTGKNTKELQKLSAAGELGRDVIAKLVAAMGESAQGAATKQMETLNGQISNLKDSYQQFLNTIATSGVLDYFKGKLESLNQTISEMSADGRLQEYAQTISDAITQAADAVGAFFAGFDFKAATQSFFSFTKHLTGYLTQIRAAFQVTSGGAKILFNTFSSGVNTLGALLSGWLGLVSNAVTRFANLLSKVGLVSDGAVRKLQVLTDSLKDASKAYADAVVQDAQDIKDGWNLVTSAYSTAGAAAKKAGDDAQQAGDKAAAATEKVRQGTVRVKQAVIEVADAEQTAHDQRAQHAKAEEAADNKRKSRLDQRLEQLSSARKIYDGIIGAIKKKNNAQDEGLKKRKAQTDEELKRLQAIEHQTTRTANALQGVENIIGGMSGALANMVEGVRSGLATLSEQTRGYFDSIMGTAKPALSALDQLRAKVQQATNALGTARANMGRLAGSVGTYIDNLALASARAQKAFYEQSLQAAQLTQQIEQNGFATARAADEAERAADAFDLLGDQQLQPLRQAISAARQEFEQLSQTIHQETASLLDELNQLQGDQASIERRHYEQQIAELREQANRAQEMGNQRAAAAAQQNLEIAQRIHDLKMRSIQEEAAAQRKADQEAARRQRETAAQSQTGTAGLTASPPARTVRLEFSAPGTGTVAGTFDEGDAERLMDILRDAGARTVQ